MLSVELEIVTVNYKLQRRPLRIGRGAFVERGSCRKSVGISVSSRYVRDVETTIENALESG